MVYVRGSISPQQLCLDIVILISVAMTLILMTVSRAISEIADDEYRGRGVGKLKNEKKDKKGV